MLHTKLLTPTRGTEAGSAWLRTSHRMAGDMDAVGEKMGWERCVCAHTGLPRFGTESLHVKAAEVGELERERPGLS